MHKKGTPTNYTPMLPASARTGSLMSVYHRRHLKSDVCLGSLPARCNCSRSGQYVSITCFMAGLTTVPELEFGPRVIKTLNLEQNELRALKMGSFFGMKIERLLLSNNSISSLNFLAFWGLEYNLATLDLSYNLFTKVPSSPLRLLRHLRSLSLKANRITALHDFDFGFLRNLEVLSLDRNPIAAIAQRTFHGTQLSLLILNSIALSDGLRSFPAHDLKLLKGLSLTENGISTLPVGWFDRLKSLRYLNLDDNELHELPVDIVSSLGATLETLELNGNRLRRIPKVALRALPNLKTFELRYNRIRKVYPRSFNCSGKLQTLDLSHNLIDKVSIWAFDGLDTIQRIDLRHNELTTLDDRTLYWTDPSGRQIFLAHNPWLCNCLLKWIKREHKRKTELSTMFVDGSDMLCARPHFLEDMSVTRVHLRDFTCDHDYYYYYVVSESEADDEEDMNDDGDVDDEYEFDDEDYYDIDKSYKGKDYYYDG
ncbi:hypothetical protein LSH36_1110g00019 [Paralvinella palmiformis]|uniref:LRRCT domain-containing protein n=1 Tax=Paralvinella palmiformis TaxID=53620 RepID=A0AAD9IW62_9ANNE|nr:hypothetical protein LSH36_1110g00019 [Paralvinella palmiformis]